MDWCGLWMTDPNQQALMMFGNKNGLLQQQFLVHHSPVELWWLYEGNTRKSFSPRNTSMNPICHMWSSSKLVQPGLIAAWCFSSHHLGFDLVVAWGFLGNCKHYMRKSECSALGMPLACTCFTYYQEAKSTYPKWNIQWSLHPVPNRMPGRPSCWPPLPATVK